MLLIFPKGLKSHYLKETWEFVKIHTYKGNQNWQEETAETDSNSQKYYT